MSYTYDIIQVFIRWTWKQLLACFTGITIGLHFSMDSYNNVCLEPTHSPLYCQQKHAISGLIRKPI